MPRRTVEQRFWEKIAKGSDPNACWEWTAGTNDKGYGVFRISGPKAALSHRHAYEIVVGQIPKGLELDHLCRNPSCVNPEHLEPVTHAENMRRGVPGINHLVKTHCPQGHPYSGDNLYRDKRGRKCRACAREARRRWREKQKG